MMVMVWLCGILLLCGLWCEVEEGLGFGIYWWGNWSCYGVCFDGCGLFLEVERVGYWWIGGCGVVGGDGGGGGSSEVIMVSGMVVFF